MATARPTQNGTLTDGRAGVRPDIAERVLGHVMGGVEGIYDRHRYDEEKAFALRALAALIEKIANPLVGKVVTLKSSQPRLAQGLSTTSNDYPLTFPPPLLVVSHRV